MPVRVTAGLGANVPYRVPVHRPAARRPPRRPRHVVRRLQPRRRRRAVPARRRRRSAGRAPHRPHQRRLARVRRGCPAGPAVRLPGARARGTPATGTASTRPSCSPTRTPEPSTATSGSTTPCSGRTRPPTTRSPTRATRRRSCRTRWSSTRPTTGGRPAARGALGRHRRLRAAREGLHRCPPRGAGAPARHVRRAGAPRRGRAPRRSRRHDGRAAAGAPLHQRADAAPPRQGQLLGLQLARLLRPARRLLGGRLARAAGDRVPRHGARPARRRPRGGARRRLQPHRRGRRRRADPVLARAGQRGLLPAASAAGATSTSPAAATRWTCGTRGRWRWSPTRCGTGSQEMHVDGFRFDLAPALARGTDAFERHRHLPQRVWRRTRCCPR